MDPDDVHAGRDAQGGRRERGLDPLVRRQVEDPAQGRLARRAQEDRPSQDPQGIEVSQERQVVFGRLAEAEARVDDDRLPLDARPERPLQRSLEIGEDLGEEVRVGRLGAVVHDDQRHTARRGQASERVVGPHGPDVVDERCARVERGLGHGRLDRIDAERRFGQCAVKGGDHGHGPPQLLLRRH